MQRWIFNIMLAGLVALLLVPVHAQDVPDSRGTDFWFTFLPSYHNNINQMQSDRALQQEHQLYIYIGADVPTTGTITLRDEFGNARTETFTITDPSVLYEFRTLFLPYELRGFNYHGLIDYLDMQNEKPANQSVHVVADQEVSVYALNQAQLNSEAFMVLPTDALGDDYVVMAYKSDTRLSGSMPNGISTPSQFAVVATEDNTVVDITPSAVTMLSNRGERQSVLLNRGQSYLVQIDPRVDPDGDLSGTLVSASKPVAVFGGHQRSTIPVEFRDELDSRDCLVEQMNPIRTWGKSAYVIPLAVSPDEEPVGTDLFRVVTAFDSTVVFVDGIEVGVINTGEVYEAPLTKASHVTSSRPVMVAMFKKTSGRTVNNQVPRIGDPFMMLVPPAEQFMKQYRFINIQANEYDFIGGRPVPRDEIYLEQWLNVLIPTVGIPSLRLDGAPVAAQFRPIAGSPYSWAQIRMTDGVHDIQADTLFGIYVYGYGRAVSYGYIGGMAFRPLDVFPPSIEGTTACGVFTGAVTDSLRGDTRVASVSVVPGTVRNATFTLGFFEPPQAVVEFEAALVDPYQDGSLLLLARDNVQQLISAPIAIPGFTIGAVGRGPDPSPELRSRVIPIGQNRCDTIVLENYGLYTRTITSLRTTGKGLVTQPALPLSVDPGDRVEVIVCRTLDVGGLDLDTLFVGDSCRERAVLAVEIDVKDDRDSPEISAEIDPCSTTVNVTIADDRPYDFGLKSIRVMDEIQRNCAVVLNAESVARTTYTVTITDPFNDAIYGFEAIDSADNSRQYIDTISGFTLAIAGSTGPVSTHRLPSTTLGTYVCDTVMLSNYGLQPQVVTDVFVRRNTLFSLPQHQFAITIPPGDSAPLIICYEPRVADTIPDLDTLVFFDGCASKSLEVAGTGLPVELQGLSRCDLPVDIRVDQLARPMTVFPQPARDQLTMVFSESVQSASVQMVSISGDVVRSDAWAGDPTNSMSMALHGVAAGAYLLIVETSKGVHYQTVIVQ